MERGVGGNKEDNLTVRTNAASSAGNLPGSVLIRYDLSGTYVHERLQYAY